MLVADTELATARSPPTRCAQAELDADRRDARVVGRRSHASSASSHAALAAAMPRRAGDLNELPDAIDSDLSGGRKRAPMTRRLLIALGLLALVAGLAVARPGGGESYSGGGGHGGGGGGGGGGDSGVFELVYWLIRLCIYVPQIGLPLLGLVIGCVVYSAYKQQKNKDWDSGPPVDARARRRASIRCAASTPTSRRSLFEDFAFRLFSTAHRARAHRRGARHGRAVRRAAARASSSRLAQPAGQPVESVVVGAMRAFRVDVPTSPVDAQGRPNRVRIGDRVRGERHDRRGDVLHGRDLAVRPRRDRAQRSHRARRKGFPCPNCGAPWQASATGTQTARRAARSSTTVGSTGSSSRSRSSSLDERPPTLTDRGPRARHRSPDLPPARRRSRSGHRSRPTIPR